MYEELLDLGAEYLIDEYRVKPEVVVFELSSTIKELQCPYCGVSSSKVHSSYIREIQDLPIQDRKTILLVKTRKMFCINNKCAKKTFSEKHSFVDTKGKKTQRLEKNIIYMSTQVSSVNASKILKATKIDVSKSSICVMLKKMPSNVDNFSVRRVCVDDFAIKKRFSYGTVMVDLESHRIIDLIPSRDVADVKEWLNKYPNIEYVSRDGAQIYASAIKGTHPQCYSDK